MLHVSDPSFLCLKTPKCIENTVESICRNRFWILYKRPLALGNPGLLVLGSHGLLLFSLVGKPRLLLLGNHGLLLRNHLCFKRCAQTATMQVEGLLWDHSIGYAVEGLLWATLVDVRWKGYPGRSGWGKMPKLLIFSQKHLQQLESNGFMHVSRSMI